MIEPLSPYTGWRSILGQPIWQVTDQAGNVYPTSTNQYLGVSLDKICVSDGASSTMLMSHKALRPSWYSAEGFRAQDGSWAYELASQLRSWAAVTRDSDNPIVLIPAGLWNQLSDGRHFVEAFFGSPHAQGMPSLYADGSVRMLSYSVDQFLLPKLWAWNDATIITTND